MSQRLDSNTRRMLRQELSTLARTPKHLRMWAEDADIPVARVNFSGSVESVTHDLLNLSEMLGGNTLRRLLEVVRKEFPQASLPTVDDTLLMSAPTPRPIASKVAHQSDEAYPRGEAAPQKDNISKGGFLGGLLGSDKSKKVTPPSADPYEFDAFLNYSSLDRAWVLEFAHQLRNLGLRVWLDVDEIAWGESIQLGITRGLKRSRHVILVLTPNSVGGGGQGGGGQEGSAWVEAERLMATFSDPANRARRLLPLLVQDCEIPEDLRPYRYLDVRTRASLELELPRLVTILKGNTASDSPVGRGPALSRGNESSTPRPVPPMVSVVQPESPAVSLPQKGHSPSPLRPNPFKPGGPLMSGATPPPGREDEADQILELVSDHNSVLVVAPRRGGKTSLLNYIGAQLKTSHKVRQLDLSNCPVGTPNELARSLDPSLRHHPEPAEALQRLLVEESTHHPVLLMDEIGALTKVDVAHSPSTFGWLRSLSQTGLLTVVYAGTYDDWRLVRERREPGSSFGNDLKHISLRPFSRDKALGWLAATTPEDVPLPPGGAGGWIHDMVGGWPFYLQHMGYKIVREVRQPGTHHPQDRVWVAAQYTELMRTDFLGVHENRWQELSREQQEILLSVDQGLPEFRQLSYSQQLHIRAGGMYLDGIGWILLEERPFMDWLETNRPSLRKDFESSGRK